jgi:phage terminase small subunit
VFVDLVTACEPQHFRPADLPLLVRYVEACVLADQAAEQLRLGAVIDGKPSPWITIQEKAVRAMVALSMRLRLSPQSRIDPKTLAGSRATAGQGLGSFGRTMEIERCRSTRTMRVLTGT